MQTQTYVNIHLPFK